jgi:hypothetical protein
MLTQRMTLPNDAVVEFFGDVNMMKTIFPEYEAKRQAERKRKQKRQLQKSARRKSRGK